MYFVTFNVFLMIYIKHVYFKKIGIIFVKNKIKIHPHLFI